MKFKKDDMVFYLPWSSIGLDFIVMYVMGGI